MRGPNEDQLRGMIDELRSLADDLELGVLDRSKPDGKRWSLSAIDLLARARIRSRDKLAASSRGRGPAGVYADRTGNEAAARVEDNDADLDHWQTLLMDLELALTYLRRTPATLAQATPLERHPDRLEVGCRVCSRPGKPEAVYRSERCEWCYRFWLRWSHDGISVDAPERILRMRREGKRITEQAIRAELQELASA